MFVAATCAEHLVSRTVLFEPNESGLPEGLMASPALVRVIGGMVYVPVVNVGTSDVLLFPRKVLGTLAVVHVVSPSAGVTEVKPVVVSVDSQTVQVMSSTVAEHIAAVDLTALSATEQSKVK